MHARVNVACTFPRDMLRDILFMSWCMSPQCALHASFVATRLWSYTERIESLQGVVKFVCWLAQELSKKSTVISNK